MQSFKGVKQYGVSPNRHPIKKKLHCVKLQTRDETCQGETTITDTMARYVVQTLRALITYRNA